MKKKKTDADTNNSKHSKKIKRSFFPRKGGYIFCMIITGLISIAFLAAMIVVDALPSDLTVILVAVMLVILIILSLLFSSPKKWKRILGLPLALAFILVFSTITGFLGNTYAMFNKISDTGMEATGPAALNVEVTEKPFNIYITGIDQWEEEKGYDLERSDVNMILTVNPVSKQILLTSIPRDAYVKLHTAQQMDKLTHTGIYGVEETLKTVEDWMGIDINYYVKMNFTAARDIINAMGGIRVYSPVEFDSSLRDYHYEKGWNDLGGREALFFARERHAFEGQDAIRVENQQRVVEAMIKKMTSSTTLLTKYGDVMDAAGDNLSTNMSADEIRSLVKMQITELSTWDMKSQKLEGEYGEDYVASLSQRNKYSVYNVSEESLNACKAQIEATQVVEEQEFSESVETKSKSFFSSLMQRLSEEMLNKEKE